MSVADRTPTDELTARTKLIDTRMSASEKKLKSKIALAITVCGLFTAASGVAAVGFHGRGALDGKANASEVETIRQRVTAVETARADDRLTLERIEGKLDWIMTHLPVITGASRARHGGK